MKLLERMKIVQKIPALAIASAVVVGLAVGAVSIFVGSQVITASEVEKLTASAEGRKHELEEYLHEIKADLGLTTKHPFTIAAIQEFDQAFDALGNNATKALQADYITNNPNPLGEKHLLDAAKSDHAYNDVHAKFHPLFRDQLEARGYYDIFLFNENGDLIYTVFKELDYATNFKTGGGEWADTDLGNAFRAGISLNKGQTEFF